jgi:CTP synthase
MKYIIVTGSVMSGIGKGITASSIGVCLKQQGLRVTAIKIDPYLNIDCGTMSPFEHGECYILDDGGETDLDLGNYERFLEIDLTKKHNITTGKIYSHLIEEERQGKYLGKTVQIIPHFTDKVQEWIHEAAQIPVDGSDQTPHVCIIELGGTVGDIESQPFVEALRQLISRNPPNNTLVVNVSYVPVLRVSDETKTKPTQHGIQVLRSLGLNPDILCVRCERELSLESRKKLSNFCQIPESHVLLNPDVNNIYDIPISFTQAGIVDLINQKMQIEGDYNLKTGSVECTNWLKLVSRLSTIEQRKTINIAIFGKYTQLNDSYLSLLHALKHGCLHNNVNHEIKFFDSEDIEQYEVTDPFWEMIERDYQVMVIPGGFGQRGIEGMIKAAQVARTRNIPCLGICLGFQVQVIEFARHVLGFNDANSSEFDPDTKYPVITIIDPNERKMGGTMRLGSHETILTSDSRARDWYGELMVNERYRHRYEVNPVYWKLFENDGLKFVGKDNTGRRMEILDLDSHPFYVGTQFHGEYRTRPSVGHPVFNALIESAIKIEAEPVN